jgi:hypothetical protein
LAILKALLPNIDSPTALSHFFRLSKLLSYENWSRLSGATRKEVTSTMRAISLCSGMEKSIDGISKLLENMFAMHPKRVEEMDYDRVLPAISGLTNPDGDNAWVSLVNSGSEPKFLTPLVYACFALLQQDDLVVSRSAFKALRALVTAAAFEDQRQQCSSSSTGWSIFIETSVVPVARSALRSSNEQVRRHAVSLIAEVSKKFAESSSPNLHGDLNILACEVPSVAATAFSSQRIVERWQWPNFRSLALQCHSAARHFLNLRKQVKFGGSSCPGKHCNSRSFGPIFLMDKVSFCVVDGPESVQPTPSTREAHHRDDLCPPRLLPF